jgi:hypothetical protein
MVASSQKVSHTAGTVEVQLNADPVSLMNTEWYRIQAASQYRVWGVYPYDYYKLRFGPRKWYYSDSAWSYLDLGMTDFLLRAPSSVFAIRSGNDDHFWKIEETQDTKTDDDGTTQDDNLRKKTFAANDDGWNFPSPKPTTSIPPTQKPVTPAPTKKPVSAPTVRAQRTIQPTSRPTTPGISIGYGEAEITSATRDFRFNKYSLWVAAAVNMRAIPISDMLTLDSDTEYTPSNRDDDTQSRRSLTEQRMSSEQRRAEVDEHSGPQRAPKMEKQDAERSESSRRLNMHSGSWGDRGKAFAYPSNLQPMIYRKFEGKMDPVWCSLKNETKGSYCWLNIAHGDDDMNTNGILFFPLIQHYNPDCLKCKKYATDSDQTAFDDGCNKFDMEFVLLFDAVTPYKPYYANFNQSNHYHYDILSVARKDMTKSGFSGIIKLNLYNTGYKHAGHTHLNNLFYALPDTQCTTPIAIAASSSKNVKACGTSYADEAIQGKTKNARGKYCFIPPESPIYRCAPSGWTCFSRGLAEAWALVQFFNAFWITALIAWLTFCSSSAKGGDSAPPEPKV